MYITFFIEPVELKKKVVIEKSWDVNDQHKRAFHLIRMHLGGGGGRQVSYTFFHCLLHAKRG